MVGPIIQANSRRTRSEPCFSSFGQSPIVSLQSSAFSNAGFFRRAYGHVLLSANGWCSVVLF